ncbi:LysE family translocator [Agarivorans sp. Z349TD_8]|uniref:LysE family translocator n=1 Tax=Agarivorans sp. Z349TD_8 TaxID=3421434 RepID=UPI003D7F114A
MDLHLWLMFCLAYLITTLSPGPNVLLVLKNSIQRGWQSAFITILGNLSCQAIIVYLVAIGIGQLIQALPFWFMVMKLLGGIYLIYLGIKSLRSLNVSSHTSPSPKPQSQRSLWALFIEAFSVSASNPKTLIFLSAFLPQFLNTEQATEGQFYLMFISIGCIVTSVHLSYAYAIGYLGKRFSFQNFERRVAKVTGGLLITMGGGMLLSQRA